MLKVFVEAEKEEPIPVEKFAELAKQLGDVETEAEAMDYFTLVQAEKVGPSGVPVPDLYKRTPDAEIGLVCYCNLSKEGMDILPNLKIVSTMRAGTENLDIEEATKRGIALVHCPGRNAEAVSDFAVAMLMTETFNVARMHMDMMKGVWKFEYPNSAITPIMKGKTCGIFGLGYIGRLTARKMKGFGMDVISYDPYVSEEAMAEIGVRKVEKDELFKESRFIIIHGRLVPETYHTIGAHELGLMRKDAILVNNARSGLIDMDALYEILKDHKIAGAALDVFDKEPLEENDRFTKLDNVTLTPHGSGAGDEVSLYAMQMAVDGVKSILDGEPNFQVINPEVTKTEEFQAWVKEANKKLGRA